jgi:hypothetical protein
MNAPSLNGLSFVELFWLIVSPWPWCLRQRELPGRQRVAAHLNQQIR